MTTPVTHQQGVTLIELVISIVVISIAVSAVLGVLTVNTGASADPMIRQQAIAIAQSHLEEIILKSFDDPDGVDGEASRALYDDLDDYDGMTTVGARDQFDTAIAGLALYTVAVAVSPSAALPAVGAVDAMRVDVRITRSPDIDITLSGYRTRF